jgi:hypothetical protein
MLLDGKEIRAGVMADMSIMQKHRTLGPALTLLDGLATSARSHFDLLYGFPNAKSIAVARRAGYPVVAELRRISCVLQHGKYLRRIMPAMLARPLGRLIDLARDAYRAFMPSQGRRLRAAWASTVDPRIDLLWQETQHGNGLVAIRDTAFLRWRFDACPAASTRYLLLCEPDGQRLVAWFACQDQGGTLHVRDFWSRDAARGLPLNQVVALLRAARRESGRGHAAVSLEYAAPSSRLSGWLAAGFVERTSRPVVGRWLDAERAGWGDIHFTAADEDE